jgi:hypothetical protein
VPTVAETVSRYAKLLDSGSADEITATGHVHTRIDGIDVMAFDDGGRITSMRAFWSTPGG